MREPFKKDKEEDYEFRERYNNYMAFMTRCRQTQINESHRNNEKFPYTADELALYMHNLCNNMEPISEDEYDSKSADTEPII